MSTGPTRRMFLGSAAAVAVGWAGTGLEGSEAPVVSPSARVFRAGAFAIAITPREFPVLINGGMSERTAGKPIRG